MGQYGLNFQSPHPIWPCIVGLQGAAIGGEGTNEQAQTPVASIAESEVPPKSFRSWVGEYCYQRRANIRWSVPGLKRDLQWEEDTLLIHHGLMFSKDAIVGIDQKAEEFLATSSSQL
ncbi:putative glutathione S-transferase [Sesbania bispinosa]|nr:putative glutathione S-transferase [Sesbania bispinosa]